MIQYVEDASQVRLALRLLYLSIVILAGAPGKALRRIANRAVKRLSAHNT